jgi:ferredoxin-fold anticodon binding domain-containing protein
MPAIRTGKLDDSLVDVFVHGVFVASVDAWVIVDFHNHVVAVDFFDVHAVESFSRDAACFERNFAEPRGHVFFL